jgi:hypothetical protein
MKNEQRLILRQGLRILLEKDAETEEVSIKGNRAHRRQLRSLLRKKRLPTDPSVLWAMPRIEK